MPIDYIWVGVISGFIAGILVNYLADVLPYTRRFSQPVCIHCQKPFHWADYLLFKTCTHCLANRSRRTWFVLIFFVIAYAFLWIHPASRLGLLIGYLLLVFFGVVVVIDLEYRLVLHQVSIAGGILGLIIGVWRHGIWMTLIGGIAGFAIMLALYYLGDVFARWMARRRGQNLEEVALGFGDVNLAGIMGLLLGWPGIIPGLVVTILVGGAVSLLFLIVLLIMRSYKPFIAIPYAPFLVISTSILLYFL
jgi:leader peptidase (prepilin peptidase)/N-methyltransferase